MNNKCIITSASNKFFPSLLNLLGSLEQNYPQHPDIYIYNLGLFLTFKKRLKSIPWVHILEIPHFVPFWRSCYTWKTYILDTPIADLNLYLDAGCEILKPLDEIFKKIEKNNYLLVNQGSAVKIIDITPNEYFTTFNLDRKFENKEIIAAGIFGFKKDSPIKEITSKVYGFGKDGYCIGFSKEEQWKNKGVNKNKVVRECRLFRHDTTLLTLLCYKYLENPIIENVDLFKGEKTGKPDQLIWNLRMNYTKLDYLNTLDLHIIEKIFIYFFLLAKKINKVIKKI